MPRVKIESALPVEKTTAVAIMKSVMDAVVETLKLVPDDRTVSFNSYEPGLFNMKPPYTLFVEISLFRGRSKAIKKSLYQAILDRLHTQCSIDKQTVMIMLNEQPRENWGLRGGIPGDEISFNYQVEI